jgi:hypothetical protein
MSLNSLKLVLSRKYYNAGVTYSSGSLAVSHASQSDLVVLYQNLLVPISAW